MDPLEPWIDASAVRRMAERLLQPTGEPALEPGPDAGFGRDFVGFTGVEEEVVLPPPLPAAEAPARVFQPVGPAVVAPPAAEVATTERRGPLVVRLARFREALIRHTGAQGVFILDREGKPVMEDAAFGKLHFLARSLAQAYRPVEGQSGNVHVKIGSNAVLEVVPVETPFGCLVLGAVVARPLAAAAVGEIATALREAATPRDSAG